MNTLNKENKGEFDSAIIEAINEEYGVEVWDEKYTEFIVGTDDEAEREYEDSLDNYVDECILPEIAEPYRFYFNAESWIADARINGSRGGSLNHYDGKEIEAEGDGESIYIYRTN